jgi:hypothetical protein
MIREKCSCNADCDFNGQGECDGNVKPIGVNPDHTWIHSCHDHYMLAAPKSIYDLGEQDWSKPGP